jgi:hypothetical protein
MRIYGLSLQKPKANLTFKWYILLTKTRKWRPRTGGITKLTFSARKEMFLLMPHKTHMADNNVVGDGVSLQATAPPVHSDAVG